MGYIKEINTCHTRLPSSDRTVECASAAKILAQHSQSLSHPVAHLAACTHYDARQTDSIRPADRMIPL